MVARAGTCMMASLLCLVPWWDGWKVGLGGIRGQLGLSLSPVVPEPPPLHAASPAESHFLYGSSGLPQVQKCELSGLCKAS